MGSLMFDTATVITVADLTLAPLIEAIKVIDETITEHEKNPQEDDLDFAQRDDLINSFFQAFCQLDEQEIQMIEKLEHYWKDYPKSYNDWVTIVSEYHDAMVIAILNINGLYSASDSEEYSLAKESISDALAKACKINVTAKEVIKFVLGACK